MLINTVVVWASLRKLKNTSYDQHIEDFPTHLQNSIRLMKIWKSLGTLGWSPTTGSDNDTCSFSRGEAGASVVEVLAVAGISSTYWMMELKTLSSFLHTVHCTDIKKGVPAFLMTSWTVSTELQ